MEGTNGHARVPENEGDAGRQRHLGRSKPWRRSSTLRPATSLEETASSFKESENRLAGRGRLHRGACSEYDEALKGWGLFL